MFHGNLGMCILPLLHKAFHKLQLNQIVLLLLQFSSALPDFLPDDLTISDRQVLRSPAQIVDLPMSFAILLVSSSQFVCY